MNFIHVVTNTLFTKQGGLEKSILRIFNALANELNNVSIYVLKHQDIKEESNNKYLKIIYLFESKLTYLLPLSENPSRQNEQNYRMDTILLKNAINEYISESIEDRHIIISFFATSVGLIAHQVAEQLGIPHIVSVRGSDFNLDFKKPITRYAFEEVIKNANSIVTTSKEQENYIRHVYKRRFRVSTIYNSYNFNDIPFWNNHRIEFSNITAFSDIGFSFNKGTVVLINSFKELVDKGYNISLNLCGKIEDISFNFWQNELKILKDNYPSFNYLGYINEEEIISNLINSHLYLNPTLGEGCSNSRLKAYCTGIPILTTKTGEALDIKLKNLFLVNPGDEFSFAKQLKTMVELLSTSNFTPNFEEIKNTRDFFSPKNERYQWESLINEVSNSSVFKKLYPERKRILFYLHDGRGLGHLQRISRIANVLKAKYYCLIVSGQRNQSDILSSDIEFIHLPNVDTHYEDLLRENITGISKDAFREVIISRMKYLNSIIENFKPDFFFSDYYPLGKYSELEELLKNYNGKKFFVMRGIIDDATNVKTGILNSKAIDFLKYNYDKIFVACDKKIIDVVSEYGLSTIADKVIDVGYVAPEISKHDMMVTRLERGIGVTDVWIVCTVGGGKSGDKIITKCLEIAKLHRNIYFDIVLGPKSSYKWDSISVDFYILENIRFFSSSNKTFLLNASADIVITSGGYNTLVESMKGNAVIVTSPLQPKTDEEQLIHPRALKKYVNIYTVEDVANLESTIELCIMNLKTLKNDDRNVLSFAGAENIAAYIDSIN